MRARRGSLHRVELAADDLAVLGLLTYVGAVMATNMYGDTDNPEVALMFGDLPRSAFSLALA